MSRSRNIKPGFFKNDLLVELPFEYRLLFIGLWTMADREGRLEDRPTKIRMEVFPADSVDVDAGLQGLHDKGFILRYAAEGGKYVQVLAWGKHQNPHMKEAKSIIPAPDKHGASTVQAPPIPEPAVLIPDSGFLIPDSSKKATVQQAAQDDGFDAFWAAYPVKKGKAAALKAWKRLRLLADDVGFLMERLHEQNDQDDDWLRGYAPHPATYLNGARWNDALAQPKKQATTQPSKTMQALVGLGASNGMVNRGGPLGLPETVMPLTGAATRIGRDRGHGDGLD